jgi:hypothetical protein
MGSRFGSETHKLFVQDPDPWAVDSDSDPDGILNTFTLLVYREIL